MCLNWFIKKRYGITPPATLTDIDSYDIDILLHAEFPDAQIYLSDNTYRTTTLVELNRFLIWDKTNQRIYVSELFDCDDFSTVLTGNINIPGWSGLPLGILWTETNGGGHAVNVFVDSDKQVWIVEPQNDSIKKIDKSWKPFLVII